MMKTPMTDHQKAQIRVDCLAIAQQKNQARGGRDSAETVAEDAETFAKFALGEG